MNWHPFIPPPDGHGNFGWGGIPTAAASIFFAYIGFDAVSTAAQEAKNPQRDMPIGILGSLVVCTILYILVSTCPHGPGELQDAQCLSPGGAGNRCDWRELGIAAGEDRRGLRPGHRDAGHAAWSDRASSIPCRATGLLPKWASAIHPKFRTPWITTIVFGSFAAIMPAFFNIDVLSELVNIGTLLAFTIVCAGVWVLRVRHPEMQRPFKTPLVPLVPILGHSLCGLPHDALDAVYVGSDDRLADHRAGDLFQLLDQAQQGAGNGSRRGS